MRRTILVLVLAMFVVRVASSNASETVIDEDFSGDLSGWITSTMGNVIPDTGASIEASELALLANSSADYAYMRVRNNTAFDAVSDVVTQSVTIGGTQEGLPNFYPRMGFYLTDATFQNGIHIRLDNFGDYARITGLRIVDGVETTFATSYYVGPILDGIDTGAHFAGDNLTVTYDTTKIISVALFDSSEGWTSTPSGFLNLNHGLDFATAFADGAYTGLSQSAGVWTTRAVRIDSVTTTATALPEPTFLEGDANGDGVVSAGDYASVQANFGNTGSVGGGLVGDANGDGVVSAGDYASVQANFGNTAPASVVPEPTIISLLSLSIVGLLRRRN